MDDKVAEEIGKLVREAETGLKLKKTGDVCPSQDVAVIFGKMHELAAKSYARTDWRAVIQNPYKHHPVS